MKNKKHRLFLRTAILILVAAALTYTLFQVFNKNEDIAKGDTAPDFVLKNLDGDQVQLKDFRGQGVLLNFWGTWCGPCKEEMPYLNTIDQKNLVKGVKILAVNIGESPYVVNNFVDRYDLKFPILLDKGKDVSGADAYNIGPMPTTFLIDPNGKVVKKIEGQMPDPDYIKKEMRLVQPDDAKQGGV